MFPNGNQVCSSVMMSTCNTNGTVMSSTNGTAVNNGLIMTSGMAGATSSPGTILSTAQINGGVMPQNTILRAPGAMLTQPPKMIITQAQLQKILANQGNANKIIRLQSPQQPLIRMQQQQPLLTLQQPNGTQLNNTQSIIRLPASQINNLQQVSNNRIVFGQAPIQITQQQLQQITQMQQQQQRQGGVMQPIRIAAQPMLNAPVPQSIVNRPILPAGSNIIRPMQLVSSNQLGQLQFNNSSTVSSSSATINNNQSFITQPLVRGNMNTINLGNISNKSIICHNNATNNGNRIILTNSVKTESGQSNSLSNHNGIILNNSIVNNSIVNNSILNNSLVNNGNGSFLSNGVHNNTRAPVPIVDDDDDITEIPHHQNTQVTKPAVKEEVVQQAEEPATEDQGEIDIVITNVVCSFSVNCNINLRELATTAFNVEYKRDNGMVVMKMRKPYQTASIWASGKITCTGTTSEVMGKKGARRLTRVLEKLGYKVSFRNFRVVNVLGTCSLPFGIKIRDFTRQNMKAASYEPELHPGVTYRIANPKATLKIFSTGNITITAPCVDNVARAVEAVYPLVSEFRMELTPEVRAQRSQASSAVDHDDVLRDLGTTPAPLPRAAAPKRPLAAPFFMGDEVLLSDDSDCDDDDSDGGLSDLENVYMKPA